MQFIFQELKNPTKEDLEFYFDSARYVLEAGKTEFYPDFLAKHGAKILADREWRNPLDKVGYEKLMNSFLGVIKDERKSEVKLTLTEEIAVAKEQIKPEVKEEEFVDLKKLPWCDTCESKGGRHLKECPKNK